MFPLSCSAGTFNSEGFGNVVQFNYPDDLILSPKLVKTHEQEVFLKSEETKGFNIGYTVDPVKINSIKDLFEKPQGLADQVVKVELGKEGVFEAHTIAAKETQVSAGVPSYSIQYSVDSSRGENYYNVKAVVTDSKLYVFTAQCKKNDLQKLEPVINAIIESVDVSLKQ